VRACSTYERGGREVVVEVEVEVVQAVIVALVGRVVMVGCGGGGGGGGGEVAKAQTFSSLLPGFMFIVGVAGSWCRLTVTERGDMDDGVVGC